LIITASSVYNLAFYQAQHFSKAASDDALLMCDLCLAFTALDAKLYKRIRNMSTELSEYADL
jgi:hypothetical protein